MFKSLHSLKNDANISFVSSSCIARTALSFSLITLPVLPSVTRKPCSSMSLYAFWTVFGLMQRVPAVSRRDGKRSPSPSAPDSMHFFTCIISCTYTGSILFSLSAEKSHSDTASPPCVYYMTNTHSLSIPIKKRVYIIHPFFVLVLYYIHLHSCNSVHIRVR